MSDAPSKSALIGRLDPAAWTAVISHDLREPMNAILGMTRLLLETRLDATQRAYAEMVEDAASGMMTLLNDLLDVNRLQRGDMHVLAEPFDLRRVVGRALELVEPRTAGRQVRLRHAVAADLPAWVVGDAGRIRQVLINLLSNAIKVTTEGEVALEVTGTPDGRIAFAVRDHGPGIARTEVERVFEPYVQLGASDGGHITAPSSGGLGLGLAIVRLVVERLGGEVTVDGGDGQGATFVVRLPLPISEAPAPARRSGIAGRTVWLVDRTTPLRERMVDTLEALGLIVTAIGSAPEAVARLGDAVAPPAALLLVTANPKEVVSGLPAMARKWPEMGLLALAASGFRGEADAWRLAGFHGYLPYPAGADLLVDALGVLFAASGDARPFITSHSLADRACPPLHLLVVDDNAMNIRLVTILLERAGHRVTVARDGQEALDALVDTTIDAVLMDVQMPGMNGLEATRRIRQFEDRRARLPVIAVTANAAPPEIDACRASGMDDVVIKPIDPSRLAAVLADAALGRHHDRAVRGAGPG